jgi:riboflavin kinase/FMN adenylyltransferase
MQVFYGIEALSPEWSGSVACMGTFDGVHVGHQEVIGRAVQQARAMELPSILITFDRNPAAILAPDKLQPSIASVSKNLEHIAAIGVDIVVILRFDADFAAISAEAFFNAYLLSAFRTRKVVIGHDFTFGKNRQGTPEWLAAHIDTQIIAPYQIGGERVGSSQIRSLVQVGKIEEANLRLGRPFEIEGIVVPGQKLGRTLGYPTLNLARSFWQVTPADGIYAAECAHPHGVHKSAVSIGVRPTVDDQRTIEAYLIGYGGADLYGALVGLKLHRMLRLPRKFDTVEALKSQIASDVAQVSRVY